MEEVMTSLTTYGYLILFAYSFSGGMIGIIAAGVLSYMGKLDIVACIVVAAIGNTVGNAFLFYMGRYNKAALAPFLKKHRRKLALTHLMLKKQGDKIIFIQKFIYGLKSLVPIAIGFTRYPQAKFHLINAIAAIFWALILGISSYQAGEILVRAATFVSDKPLLAPLVLLIVLGSLWLYMQKATQRKQPKR